MFRSDLAPFRSMLRASSALTLTLVFAALLAAQTNPASTLKPSNVPPQLVTPQMRILTLAGRSLTKVDEYYDTETDVWSVIFVDDPQHPESFANEVILNFYNSSPKPTPESVANALSSERTGTKYIFSFKAPDEPNGQMRYHVVNLTLGREPFVNLMTVDNWETSATTINFSHRLHPSGDLNKIGSEAKQWLLSPEGNAFTDAAGALRVGAGWPEYLKRVK